jgi:thiol:disulfide interchange protein DsbC
MNTIYFFIALGLCIGFYTWRRRSLFIAALSIGASLLLSGVAIAPVLMPGDANAAVPVSKIGANSAESKLLANLKQRLPKTQISHADCSRYDNGFCEIVAGRSVFYTSKNGRYLVIGRVYDVETREDVTAARLLELSPDTLLARAARMESSADTNPGQQVVRGGANAPIDSRSSPQSFNTRQLSAPGAIRWGGGINAPKVTVFSDLNCGYCKLLHGELKKLGWQVEERFVSIMGSRPTSEAVYCSKSPSKSLSAAYQGNPPGSAAGCDTRGLDANEAMFRQAGFTGTPVLITSNGVVLEGYRQAAELQAWHKAVTRTSVASNQGIK